MKSHSEVTSRLSSMSSMSILSAHRFTMATLLVFATLFCLATSDAETSAVAASSAVSDEGGSVQSRYGGPVKRPSAFGQPPFSRPNYPSMLIPSPSHAYSILARPQPPQLQRPHPVVAAAASSPPRFQLPRPQQPQPPPPLQPIQNHGIRFQPGRPQPQLQFQPTLLANNFQRPRPIQPQQTQQAVYYPEIVTSSQTQSQPQSVNYVPQPSDVGFQPMYRPLQLQQQQQQSVSYHQPSPQYVSSSAANWVSYAPQPSPSSQSVHYHLHKQPLAAAGSGQSATQVVSYEPCTSTGWSPMLSTSSLMPQSSSASAQLSNFIQRPVGHTSFRYQPDSSNKVVVLSHDVLKTLLANSNKNNDLTKHSFGVSKGTVETAAASSPTATIVNANGNSLDKTSGTPSVKLVGYIGPSSDKTPSGYIQVPVNKQILESLSPANMNTYDLTASNTSRYSLFTMKSVNDVQSLLGVIKDSGPIDQDTSASENIPLGLVVSADGKPPAKVNDHSSPIFYPSPATSSASASETNNNSPSIQMVGHVQVTSPDVSSQFTKRKGQQDDVNPRSAQDKSDSDDGNTKTSDEQRKYDDLVKAIAITEFDQKSKQ